jgi:hypothetical protein
MYDGVKLSTQKKNNSWPTKKKEHAALVSCGCPVVQLSCRCCAARKRAKRHKERAECSPANPARPLVTCTRVEGAYLQMMMLTVASGSKKA